MGSLMGPYVMIWPLTAYLACVPQKLDNNVRTEGHVRAKDEEVQVTTEDA